MATKKTTLSICNETIYPGEALSLALPLPELFSCAPMYMPIKVVHGKKPGPCLLVIAALHGNELNGAEIIHRLLNTVSTRKLEGTLIAVPILNVYGFVNKTRATPGSVSLDHSFPGAPTGSYAARMAHLFCSKIFSLADYCIDLQTGWLNYSNVPHVFANPSDTEALALAHTFGAPVISMTQPEPHSLRAYAKAQNKPYLVYEAGEAMRFDEHAIRVGLKGVLHVMRHLRMLGQMTKTPSQHDSFLTHESYWVRSPTSGINHPQIQLGQSVKKGDILGVIKDPFGAGENVTVHAPLAGVVVSLNNLPLVYEGIALCQIAAFQASEKAASHLEDWPETRASDLQ